MVRGPPVDDRAPRRRVVQHQQITGDGVATILALVVDWLIALLVAQVLSAALDWSPGARGFVTLAIFAASTTTTNR